MLNAAHSSICNARRTDSVFPLPEGWSAPHGRVRCITSRDSAGKQADRLVFKGRDVVVDRKLPWGVLEALVGLEEGSTQLNPADGRQIADKERRRIIGKLCAALPTRALKTRGVPI